MRRRRQRLAAGVMAVMIPVAYGSTSPSLIEKGEYLATAGNCGACHTKPGAAPFAGGVAFETPFGTVYSTNITTDRETGIGAWTLTQFRSAMREGIRPGGEHLYPVFPYTAFTKLSDADVAAIFAYLQTLPPVRSSPPANELSFPFNQRRLLGIWKALYFDGARFAPNPAKSSQWNRGAYLVEGLGHCGACHTPRNFLGAERTDWSLAGGTYLDRVPGGQIREWSAVNLTPAASGLGAWSTEDIVSYLQAGVNSFATTFGPMNEVIMQSTRQLRAADVRAIASYLRGVDPKEQSSGPEPDEDLLRTGETLYTVHCATCHVADGKGAIDTGPALAGNPVVQAADPASLINVILYGPELPDPPPPPNRQHMEAYGEELNDEEIAALTSFLRGSWGNRGGAVSARDVAGRR